MTVKEQIEQIVASLALVRDLKDELDKHVRNVVKRYITADHSRNTNFRRIMMPTLQPVRYVQRAEPPPIPSQPSRTVRLIKGVDALLGRLVGRENAILRWAARFVAVLAVTCSVVFGCALLLQAMDRRPVVQGIPGATPTNPNFRNVAWGMSRNQVRKLETAEQTENLLQDEGRKAALFYRTAIYHLDCMLGYIFIDDRLIRASYALDAHHVNPLLYLADYDTLKRGLTRKYGKPMEDEVVWVDDLYKDNPQMHGLAVVTGHRQSWATWETETTTIGLYLDGDNFEATVTIEYNSKALGHLEDKVVEQQNLRKL